ncbi:immediate early response 3-interacting protein 1 [Nematocida sp. AWRm80]|nr:immediate early response 3-interacting protein 1 [Nematocida sp. AWRm80]
MFGIITIVYVFTLLGNSICILNEERVLNNLGIGRKSKYMVLRQLSELIRTFKTLFIIPLIVSNCIFILYEILLG